MSRIVPDRCLNRADYGRGAVSLTAAAQTWFDKPAAPLTVAEAAVLAVQLHASPAGPGSCTLINRQPLIFDLLPWTRGMINHGLPS